MRDRTTNRFPDGHFFFRYVRMKKREKKLQTFYSHLIRDTHSLFLEGNEASNG